ncbi:hypothetical protein F4820DRAFT_415411 [Hypoxylon rubiginosum]|uniref:Uncharacterized protein n=1 Tax=Hypoxylon rubiginosum TaxID=110542 RepID=A0ACB9Z6I8_9PEZI|nr:hypothetical protein F4820DRAFT_415411 [Hypoxylon rubiginosum]
MYLGTPIYASTNLILSMFLLRIGQPTSLTICSPSPIGPAMKPRIRQAELTRGWVPGKNKWASREQICHSSIYHHLPACSASVSMHTASSPPD